MTVRKYHLPSLHCHSRTVLYYAVGTLISCRAVASTTYIPSEAAIAAHTPFPCPCNPLRYFFCLAETTDMVLNEGTRKQDHLSTPPSNVRSSTWAPLQTPKIPHTSDESWQGCMDSSTIPCVKGWKEGK